MEAAAFNVGGLHVQIETDGSVLCTKQLVKVATVRQIGPKLMVSCLFAGLPRSRMCGRLEHVAIAAAEWWREEEDRRLAEMSKPEPITAKPHDPLELLGGGGADSELVSIGRDIAPKGERPERDSAPRGRPTGRKAGAGNAGKPYPGRTQTVVDLPTSKVSPAPPPHRPKPAKPAPAPKPQPRPWTEQIARVPPAALAVVQTLLKVLRSGPIRSSRPRALLPPPPASSMILIEPCLLIGFPWLENEPLRTRFAAAIARVTGTDVHLVAEDLAAGGIRASLAEAAVEVARMGRAWGVVPDRWPPPMTAKLSPPAEQLDRTEKSWSRDEKAYLEDHWGVTPIEQIMEHLRRSENGVRIMAKKLGLTMKRQVQKLGLYPMTTYSRLLKLDIHTVAWWCDELGLPSQESVAIGAGQSRCRLVKVSDMYEFLVTRPEFFAPERRIDRQGLIDIGLDLPADVLTPSWRFKRVTCRAGERHATNRPLEFWAAFDELFPMCPCCGQKCGQQASGNFATRYKVRRRNVELEPYQLVSPAGAQALRIVSTQGGRADLTLIADRMKGGYAESDEITQVRQVLQRLERVGQLSCERNPIKGSKKGAPRVWYSLTEAGRSALNMLDALLSGRENKTGEAA